MEIFISYSSKDIDKAQLLEAFLTKDGFSVWRDQNRLRTGVQFTLEIENAIRRADIVVVLVSASAKESNWVLNETLFASDLSKIIFPLMLEPDIKLPIHMYGRHYIEMYTNWQSGYSSLLTNLQLNSYSENERQDKFTTSENSNISSLSTNVAFAGSPFVYGSIVPEQLFIGRKNALSAVIQRIAGVTLQSISIVANRRMGKSSLLNYLTKMHDQVFPHNYKRQIIYVSMMDAKLHSVTNIMRTIRRNLKKLCDYEIWPDKYDGNLAVMSEAFEDYSEISNSRLVICLDEWESVMAYPQLDEFVETMREAGAHSHIGMVVSTSHTLIDLTISNKLTSPFYNIFNEIYLGLMPYDEWSQVVVKGFQRIGQIMEDRDFNIIYELAGGHPYLTQLAGHLLLQKKLENWSESHLASEYKSKASIIFSSIIHGQSKEQNDALLYVLGLTGNREVSENMLQDLIWRGVLNQSGEIFCKPFADFIFNEMPRFIRSEE